MKIFLFRHGETQYNVDKILSGSQNVQLTPKGEEQAKSLSQRLSSIDYTIAISSDLDRSVNTLKFVVGAKPTIQTKLLRERNFGKYEGGSARFFFDAMNDAEHGREEFCPEGGESFAMVEERLKKLWQKHLASIEGTVLLSGHGSLNRSLIKLLLGLSYREQFELQQENTCLNVLEGTSLGDFKAHKINCTQHLAESNPHSQKVAEF